jgi:SecD/SecF fusion protein
LIAIGALLLNLFFIFGCLSSFGTVLTLAGIAGVVLTIGMAVDASVIIYERIKEELRAGKSNLAAIQDGFSNSYSAIIDANVTTILVAGVLAYFGLGPIKGFAIVLIIGVICSLFTAVLVGKMIIDWYTKDKGNELSFWTGFSKDKFANLQIDWMGKRKIAYVISGVFIVAGLASIFTRGFDLGVDFKGGYAYNVQFAEGSNVDTEAIKQGLTEILGSTPEVKAVDSDNTLRILTSYLIEENGEDTDVKVMDKINEGLNNVTGASTTLAEFMNSSSGDDVTHITQSNKVQPTIADDIKQSSKYAGVIALILIFLYIFLRFNKWQYSLGAVAALLHDALIVLGIFSLCKGVLPFALSVDQNFVAAILTVIGYSINDTVVVFDRIREYMGIYTNKPKNEVINMAVNSTFSRTLITSFTTLLVVLILFIFGGSAIKGFAFALIVGIVVGTYSSVFVATPIVSDLADNLRTNRRANSGSSNKGGKSFGRSAKAASDSSAS